jgi:hypothetical protein
MSWIWMNIPLCVLAVAFTVGLPAWVIWKHPDEGDPRAAQAAAKESQERTAAAAPRQQIPVQSGNAGLRAAQIS